MMNPNPGHPPERIDRSNHVRARAVSPRTRYQLPTPNASVAIWTSAVSAAREHLVGTDLAAIQLQPLRVGVRDLQRVGTAIEHRFRFCVPAGARQRHPEPVGRARQLTRFRRAGLRASETHPPRRRIRPRTYRTMPR